MRTLAVWLIATGAWAQLVIVRPDGMGGDIPINGVVDVGSAAPGDVLDTRLRVRNAGTTPVDLQTLKVEGVGFSLEGTPARPYTMAAGTNVDFRLRFRPSAPGLSYSATVFANSVTAFARGSSPAGLTLLRDGVAAVNDKPFEFGIVEVGQRGRIVLTLRNDAATELPVRLVVSGAGFAISTSIPAALKAGEEGRFEIWCEPVRAGLLAGALQLDARTFTLNALGREPAVPSALLEFDTDAARSGRQSTMRIRLGAAAPTAVAGTLQLEFKPAVEASAGDDAIQFLANSSRLLPLQLAKGATEATHADKPGIVFQTGSTAGTLVFRLKLGSQDVESAIALPAEAPRLDTVELRRAAGSVDVVVTGFDNHRTAGNAIFTFTDQAGQDLPAISAEAGAAFAQHFRESSLGGLFKVTARFPVNGDSSRVAKVAVRLANSIGAGAGRSE